MRGVLDGRRDRHRDGQHVVDEQRARDREPGAAGRGSSWPPRSRHRRTGRRARSAGTTPPRRHHERRPRRRSSSWRRDERRRRRGRAQEDLVGGVGDRRQRVAGEHRQRDALREQRLPELVAAQRSADEEALEHYSVPGTTTLYADRDDAPTRSGRARHRAELCPRAYAVRCSVASVHFVIMGCGRVGSTLAHSLEEAATTSR